MIDERKIFYAGGFFYNPNNNKVLLQLRDDKTPINPNMWGFFGGSSENNEKPIETFIREIKEELEIVLKKNEIKELCNYYNPDYHMHRYVFFVDKDVNEKEIILNEGKSFKWVALDEVFGYKLTKRTKQDLKYFINNKLK